MKGFLICVVLSISGILAIEVIATLAPECRFDELHRLWPNFNDETKFYRCSAHGRLLTLNCATGTKFNFALQACLKSRDWKPPQIESYTTTALEESTLPPGPSLPDIESLVPKCRDDQLPWLWPNYIDATRFYKCGAVGWVLSMPCALGTKFDYFKQKCVHSNDWLPPPPPSIPPGNLPEIETLVPECREDQLNWLWPNFNDPTIYYVCHLIGRPLGMRCPPGTKFSFESQICVIAREWVPPRPPLEQSTEQAEINTSSSPVAPNWPPQTKIPRT